MENSIICHSSFKFSKVTAEGADMKNNSIETNDGTVTNEWINVFYRTRFIRNQRNLE